MKTGFFLLTLVLPMLVSGHCVKAAQANTENTSLIAYCGDPEEIYDEGEVYDEEYEAQTEEVEGYYEEDVY